MASTAVRYQNKAGLLQCRHCTPYRAVGITILPTARRLHRNTKTRQPTEGPPQEGRE